MNIKHKLINMLLTKDELIVDKNNLLSVEMSKTILVKADYDIKPDEYKEAAAMNFGVNLFKSNYIDLTVNNYTGNKTSIPLVEIKVAGLIYVKDS